MNMGKEDYFRFLIIYGLTDDDLDNIRSFNGWIFKKEYDMLNAYIFENVEIGVQITFRKRFNGDYQSINVLPVDSSKLNSSNYEEGFDSSDNQMEDIKDDILYKFCLSFNVMAGKEMIGTDRLWFCGIIPSIADCGDANWE